MSSGWALFRGLAAETARLAMEKESAHEGVNSNLEQFSPSHAPISLSDPESPTLSASPYVSSLGYDETTKPPIQRNRFWDHASFATSTILSMGSDESYLGDGDSRTEGVYSNIERSSSSLRTNFHFEGSLLASLIDVLVVGGDVNLQQW